MGFRLLIVGMGSIGLRHARLYTALPGVNVEVCDSREGGILEVQALINPVCWTNFDDALNSKPDAVLIATPHHLHGGMARACLEKKIPVLCEKPMSHDVAEAISMVATATRTATPLAVGFHLRFHPSVKRLRGMLKMGALGKIYSIRYCVDSLITLQNSRSRYQADMKGALLMDYSHGLDLLLHLLEIEPVQAMCRGVAGSIKGLKANPLVLSALLSYREPILAEIHLSYTGKPELHNLEILSEAGRVVVELNSGVWVQTTADDGHRVEEKLEYERDRLYLEQWEDFRRYCSNRSSEICTGSEALKGNHALEMILRSLSA